LSSSAAQWGAGSDINNVISSGLFSLPITLKYFVDDFSWWQSEARSFYPVYRFRKIK
jgi:hypothetical protein